MATCTFHVGCSFDPTDSHIWLELYAPPTDKDVETLGGVCSILPRLVFSLHILREADDYCVSRVLKGVETVLSGSPALQHKCSVL